MSEEQIPEIPDAHWVELLQGPLDGMIVTWEGKPGDRKNFRLSIEPAEHLQYDEDLTQCKTITLGRSAADALKKGLNESTRDKGWNIGWCEVYGICAKGGNPKGVATYQLTANDKALHEPHAQR